MSGPFAEYANILKARAGTITPLGLQTITIFGDEGSGKSLLAAGFPNHMYYDLEGSAVNYDKDELGLPHTWVEFKKWVVAVSTAAKSPWDGKTLIIDTPSDLWDLCLAHEMAARKLQQLPDDFGRTLSAIRREFLGVLNRLLKLSTQQRMGSVFVCHEENQEIKTPEKTYHRIRPYTSDNGPKGTSRWFAAKPQMVLRTSVEDFNPLTKSPWPEPGPKFILRAKRMDSSDVVKDRTRRLPPFMGTDYSKLALAYEGHRE